MNGRPSPSADRALRLLVGPLVFLAVATGIRPELAGVYGDDAIYLATGASVAAGLGPIVAELPTAPYITKYPPLYTWLLAALDRLGLGLDSAFGVGLVMALSAAAWAIAVDRLVNGIMTERGATPTERTLVAVSCGVNTLVVATVPTVMTEGLYTLILVSQLRATGLASGVLAFLGGGLRSAGLVLNLSLAGPRAWAVLAGTAAAVGLTAWARAGWPVSADFLYYFADYRTHTSFYTDAWNGGGASALAGRIAQVVAANVQTGTSALGELVFPMRTGGAAGDPWPYGLGVFGVAVYGLARRAPQLLLPVVANTALFLVWTWPFAPRFWLPVYPLVVAGAVWGLAAVPRVGRLLVVPVVGLFAVGNGILPATQLYGRFAPAAEVAPAEAQLEGLERWLDGRLGAVDGFVGGPESLWLARRHAFWAIPLKSLGPRDGMLSASLGIPGPEADAGPGLRALRSSLPDVEILVVLPDGAAPPDDALVGVPSAPPGYQAWVLPKVE